MLPKRRLPTHILQIYKNHGNYKKVKLSEVREALKILTKLHRGSAWLPNEATLYIRQATDLIEQAKVKCEKLKWWVEQC